MAETGYLIAPIVALAIVYGFLPQMSSVYRQFNRPLPVRCPETGDFASVLIDSPYAARTSLVGIPKLRIKDCSRWPAWSVCDRGCLKGEVDRKFA